MKNLVIGVCIACLFAACSEEDRDPDYALEVAGTYVGHTSVAFQYSPTPQEFDDELLTLTASSAGKIGFSYENADWGTYTVRNMEVSLENGNYVFSGQDSLVMGMGEKQNKYLFTLEGKVNATTQVASFVVQVPAVMGGVTVTYSEGMKQTKN